MYEGAGTSLAIKEVSRRGTHHCTPTVKYLLETPLSSQTQCDYPQEDERRWSTNGPQMATHQWTMNGRFRGGGVGLAARDIDRREDHGISCVKNLVPGFFCHSFSKLLKLLIFFNLLTLFELTFIFSYLFLILRRSPLTGVASGDS